MKRWLLAIPMFFVILLNACGGGSPQLSSPDQAWTSLIQTQTATMWTVVPTQTFNPNIPNMISTLNVDLSIINPLELTLDAGYRVDDIQFKKISGYPGSVFRVDVRCECMNGEDCCHPERTFVAVLGAMRRNSISILAYVPADVGHLLVVCLDQRKQIGAMSVSWQDVRDYLIGNLTGYQFGVRVTKADIPK